MEKTVRCASSSVFGSRSSVVCFLFSVFCSLSSVFRPLFSVLRLLSSAFCPLSTTNIPIALQKEKKKKNQIDPRVQRQKMTGMFDAMSRM